MRLAVRGVDIVVTPASRLHPQNQAPVNPHGDRVVYWMTTSRRTRANFALQRAVELSLDLGKPLLILEALRVDYPYASDRLHRFVIEGMRENARATTGTRATYYPYVEPQSGAGRGLLATLAARAAVVVTDWFPGFFLPRMIAAAAAQSPVRLEAVDANGLIPVADHGRMFPSARGYRAFVQRCLVSHLAAFPNDMPLARLEHDGGTLPETVTRRWPPAALEGDIGTIVGSLPIDH